MFGICVNFCSLLCLTHHLRAYGNYAPIDREITYVGNTAYIRIAHDAYSDPHAYAVTLRAKVCLATYCHLEITIISAQYGVVDSTRVSLGELFPYSNCRFGITSAEMKKSGLGIRDEDFAKLTDTVKTYLRVFAPPNTRPF